MPSAEEDLRCAVPSAFLELGLRDVGVWQRAHRRHQQPDGGRALRCIHEAQLLVGVLHSLADCVCSG